MAGISISALTNQGLFTQANNAKRESEIASIKEQIALDIYEKQLEPPVGSITDEQLETILEKHGTVNKEDGTIVGITTEKGYEILLKDIYGSETVAESVPDGAIVTPVNDITTWLKTGEISNQYSYTTIEQVIADSTCTQSLMNNENAMKYLARSTEFADAICASETTMTYLGQSAYIDDTVLNSDYWIEKCLNSDYFDKIFVILTPTMTSNTTPDDIGYCFATNVEESARDAYKAFDKKISGDSYGTTRYKNTNNYIGYAFNNKQTVLKTVIYPNIDHNGTHLKNYKFQYSDDNSNWTDAQSGTLPSGLDALVINKKINARYFRLYCIDSYTDWHSIQEIYLYGR